MGAFDLTRALIGAGLGTLAMPGVGTIVGALVGGLTSTPGVGQQNPVDILVPPDPTPGGNPHAPPPGPPPEFSDPLQTGKTILGISGTATGVASALGLGPLIAPVLPYAAPLALIIFVDYKLITSMFEGSDWGPCGQPPVEYPMTFEFHDWLLRRDPRYANAGNLQTDLVTLALQNYYADFDMIRGGGCVQGQPGDVIYGADSQPMRICVIVPTDVIELLSYPYNDPPPPQERRWAFDAAMLKWIRCRGFTSGDYGLAISRALHDVTNDNLSSQINLLG